MWKHFVELDRPQMILCPLRAVYLRLQYTHSGCVALIAYPQQQQLHEHAKMLRYTNSACLANAYLSHHSTRHAPIVMMIGK